MKLANSMGRNVTRSKGGYYDLELYILFAVSTVVVFAAFMPMLLRNHYSTDSYHLIKDQHTLWYLQCGRYTFWIFASFFEKLGVNLVLKQRWFILFCLFSLSGCITALVRLLERQFDRKSLAIDILLVIPLSLTWCNVYLEDWILFPEVAGMIAIAAIVLTASVVAFFRYKGLTSFFSSAVLLVVALGSYQSMVGSYIAAIVIVSCYKYRFDLRSAFSYSIKGIAIGGLCAILNIMILKAVVLSGFIGDSGRGSTFDLQVIFGNYMQIVEYQASFWKDADGLLPCPVMQILEVVFLMLFTSVFRRSIKRGFSYVLAFVVSLGSAYAPHYVEASILLSPRSNIAVWTVIGCMLAVLLCDRLFDIDEEDVSGQTDLGLSDLLADKAIFVAECLLILFYAASAVFMWDIAYDVYASNVQDREYANSIAEAIQKYETNTGSVVNKIGAVDDASVQTSYKETRYSNHELGRRIMNVDYSRIEMINWISGRYFEQVDVTDEEAMRLFGNKDWDHEDLEEQLKFEDGVAYLSIY